MVKGTLSRQAAQTPWARSRSTLAGSGTKAAKGILSRRDSNRALKKGQL